MKTLEFKYIINKIWIVFLKFCTPILINLYFLFEKYDSETSFKRLFIISIPALVIHIGILITVCILTFKQSRNYQWVKNLKKDSISKWNHYIFEKRLSNKNEQKIDAVYHQQLKEVWNKDIDINNTDKPKIKKQFDIVYVYYLFVSSLLTLILNVITLGIHFHELMAYQNNIYGKIILYFIASLCISYFLLTIINGIILGINKHKNHLRINNQDLLSPNTPKENLKDYILLNAISYLPKNRESFFKWFNEDWLMLISPTWFLSYVIFDPIGHFSRKQFYLINCYKKFDDPKIKILNPSQTLITKIKYSEFQYTIENDAEIVISFNKEHIEYPKLFQVIHCEKNLKIITNDLHFQTFFEIVLENIYQTSISKINCDIKTQDILEWQKDNYLNKRISKAQLEEEEINHLLEQ
ncbi:Uncharacterised protein [Metamycoplasma cloacale]|uniref:Uncharacterized protein n=1 Tax=Metamycoplasma cloacale TaxID=92401 RepID=A0A2Z4LM84_9BACT|nr:hypothetical protein [Metamycoplasma cloacale]AWX42911.1 hypothetical protein DK849_02475 [Metamycoplasma cloacale]VEU79265.1 Uncharacterised protein [Metamycoplasma cloacale]